jgi:predicted transcriptional regulator of viral defense system
MPGRDGFQGRTKGLAQPPDDAYLFAARGHDINGVAVEVYSPAKTVADCFKFRSKAGPDVAIEALRDAWRSRKASMDELMEAAKICKMSKVMLPYLEATGLPD